MSHVSIPDGCSHLDWRWERPDGNPAHPQLGDQRGQLLTQFVTWIVPAGATDNSLPAVPVVDGTAHLCQVDPDNGDELWVAELEPAD
jgi:hypothetical protein